MIPLFHLRRVYVDRNFVPQICGVCKLVTVFYKRCSSEVVLCIEMSKYFNKITCSALTDARHAKKNPDIAHRSGTFEQGKKLSCQVSLCLKFLLPFGASPHVTSLAFQSCDKSL